MCFVYVIIILTGNKLNKDKRYSIKKCFVFLGMHTHLLTSKPSKVPCLTAYTNYNTEIKIKLYYSFVIFFFFFLFFLEGGEGGGGGGGVGGA